MSSSPALEATGLKKIFSTTTALDGFDLRVDPGIAFGLIGPNGAGKTTFIKALLGVIRPTSGEIRLLGGSPLDPKRRSRVGYLPERLYLPPASTPVAFLQSICRFKGLPPRRADAVELLERVGIRAETLSRKMAGFSKGMKQRVGLAGALVGSPELIVLDEPTDGVDPMGRIEIRKILSEEKSRGATIFLNSHLLAEAERFCDRVGIVARGKLKVEGSVVELTRSPTSWRVRFENGDPVTLAMRGFSPTEQAGVWSCEAADAIELDHLLASARQVGALVTELNRSQRDLEQVFASVVAPIIASSVVPAVGRRA